MKKLIYQKDISNIILLSLLQFCLSDKKLSYVQILNIVEAKENNYVY